MKAQEHIKHVEKVEEFLEALEKMDDYRKQKKTMDDVIKLSVGGQIFVTTRGTLCACSGSMLARKFDKDSNFGPPTTLLMMPENDDHTTKCSTPVYFIDRSPKLFEHVLNYLRNGCDMEYFDLPPSNQLKQFRGEADYFGLVELKKYIDNEIAKLSLPETKTRKEHVVVPRCDFGNRASEYGDWEVVGVIPSNGDPRLIRSYKGDIILSRDV